jgi:cytidine deaminase
MSTPKRIVIDFREYASAADLHDADRVLLQDAHAAALRAYAPYSNFLVGAALRTRTGQVVIGNNQENASYPAGICAERTALHAAMSLDPETVVEVMAIVVPSITGLRPVSPCGICRQALLEQEMRQRPAPMRILMAVPNGPVLELGTAGDLLPLSFDASFLTS